jgi:hypothetical protein
VIVLILLIYYTFTEGWYMLKLKSAIKHEWLQKLSGQVEKSYYRAQMEGGS